MIPSSGLDFDQDLFSLDGDKSSRWNKISTIPKDLIPDGLVVNYRVLYQSNSSDKSSKSIMIFNSVADL